MKQTQEDMLISEAYNKVNKVTEASTSNGASNTSNYKLMTDLIESNPSIENIEVITNHGNVVLPIVEMWVQDGVLKVSIDHSPLMHVAGVN